MKTRPKKAAADFFRRLGFEARETSFKWRTKKEGGEDVSKFLRMFARAQSKTPSDKICY